MAASNQGNSEDPETESSPQTPRQGEQKSEMSYGIVFGGGLYTMLVKRSKGNSFNPLLGIRI